MLNKIKSWFVDRSVDGALSLLTKAIKRLEKVKSHHGQMAVDKMAKGQQLLAKSREHDLESIRANRVIEKLASLME